jgi:hypothetical protein
MNPAIPEETQPDNKPSYEEQLVRYNAHLEERKPLEEALLEVSGRFTQWSLTLSGGALALSITYVEKLTPALAAGRWLLITSWSCLSLSIITNLFSLFLSQKAILKAIDMSVRRLVIWRKDPIATYAQEVNKQSTWTLHLAVASLIFFTLGVIFMCLFVYLSPPIPSTPKS